MIEDQIFVFSRFLFSFFFSLFLYSSAPLIVSGSPLRWLGVGRGVWIVRGGVWIRVRTLCLLSIGFCVCEKTILSFANRILVGLVRVVCVFQGEDCSPRKSLNAIFEVALLAMLILWLITPQKESINIGGFYWYFALDAIWRSITGEKIYQACKGKINVIQGKFSKPNPSFLSFCLLLLLFICCFEGDEFWEQNKRWNELSTIGAHPLRERVWFLRCRRHDEPLLQVL